MNLTPKSWRQESEITPKNAKVGSIISYSDVCNFIRYRIIDLDETSITIQDVDDPEWVDIKTFEQLSKRWEFCLNEKGGFCV